MYISFDLLIKIGQVILIAAGCAVLIYLALCFKHLIDTIRETTKTLELLQKDLEKLESPLDTVDAVSKTVDELHASVKKTATTALGVMDDSLNNLKNRLTKPTPAKKRAKAEQASPAMQPQEQDEPEEGAEFVPIVAAEQIVEEAKAQPAEQAEVIVIDETKDPADSKEEPSENK